MIIVANNGKKVMELKDCVKSDILDNGIRLELIEPRSERGLFIHLTCEEINELNSTAAVLHRNGFIEGQIVKKGK